MAKSAPKAMRFDGDVENYINDFEGDNFSDKFHKLVRFFKDTEKEKQEKIKSLDATIKEREKRLQELSLKLSSVAWLEKSFDQLKNGIEQLKRGISGCDMALKDVIQKDI